MGESNSLYKCLKKSKEPKYMGLSCQWSGSVLDYAAHIRVSHPDSVLRIRESTAFHWKLPLEDCFDKGLIQHKSKYYLYELYHKKTEDNGGATYIALSTSCEEQGQYKLCVLHRTLEDFHTSQDFNTLETLSTPIDQKPHITLPTTLLNTYCDITRNIRFKFVFKSK